MATPDDDSLVAEMIRTVRSLTKQFEEYTKAGDKAHAELVEAWRIHRDVVNRAIGYLNHEVIGFQQRLDDDDTARKDRQVQVDDKMQKIIDGQAQIKRRQTIRIGLELFAILVVIAFVIGRSL